MPEPTQAEFEALAQKIKKRLGLIKHFAKLGDSDDLQFATVQEPMRKGYVRVRLQNDDTAYRVVKSGVLGAYTPTPGFPVIVGYDEKGDMAIISADFDGLLQAGVNPEVLNSGDPRMSAFNQTDGLLPLMSGAVSGGSTAGTQTNEVFINAFRFVDKYNQVRHFTGALVDLSAYVPSANQHCYVVLFLVLSDLSIEVQASTAKASITPLTDTDKQECYDSRSDGTIPIFLWRLHDAQTYITNADRIEDLRPWMLGLDPALKIMNLGDADGSTPSNSDTIVYNATNSVFTTANKIGWHGFLRASDGGNPTDATLAYDYSTRTVSLTPTGSTFTYYQNGLKYTSGTISDTHANTTGTYFWYYNSAGTLTLSTTSWSLLTDVPICAIIFSTSAPATKKGFGLEERHGYQRNVIAHKEFHEVIGTYYASGLAIADYTVQPVSPANSDNQFSISAGVINDEDIKGTISALAAAGPYTIFYRSGATGEWLWNTNTVPVLVGTTYPYWNEYTGATWQLTELAANKYMNIYVLETDSIDTSFQHILLVDQTQHDNLADAQADTINNMDLSGLPLQEVITSYQITIRTSASYSSATGRFRISATPIDTRESTANQIISSVTPVTNHNSLSGLQGGTAGEYYHLTSTEYSGISTVTNIVGKGRLTPTSGKFIEENDVSGATTIYYTSEHGEFTQLSLSLAGATANTLYDFYAYESSGVWALEATSWGTNTSYNITGATAASQCVITYSNTSQVFAIGDRVCIQEITGDINTKLHCVTSVTNIGTVSAGVSYQIRVNIYTVGLTYTSGGTVRKLYDTAIAKTTPGKYLVKSSDTSRYYLGNGLISGDGAEIDFTEGRRCLANYYQRQPIQVVSAFRTSTTTSFTGGTIYQLAGVNDECSDGFGRFSFVAPYNGTQIKATWGTGGFPSVAAISTVVALEQNTILDFSRIPAGDNAFAAQPTYYGALFSSLYDTSQNEGFNFVQMMVYGTSGATHTVWTGYDTSSGKFRFGTRGKIWL